MICITMLAVVAADTVVCDAVVVTVIILGIVRHRRVVWGYIGVCVR